MSRPSSCTTAQPLSSVTPTAAMGSPLSSDAVSKHIYYLMYAKSKPGEYSPTNRTLPSLDAITNGHMIMNVVLPLEPGPKVDWDTLRSNLGTLHSYISRTESGPAMLAFFSKLFQRKDDWVYATIQEEVFKANDRWLFECSTYGDGLARQNDHKNLQHSRHAKYKTACQSSGGATFQAIPEFEARAVWLKQASKRAAAALVAMKLSHEMWRNSGMLWEVATTFSAAKKQGAQAPRDAEKKRVVIDLTESEDVVPVLKDNKRKANEQLLSAKSTQTFAQKRKLSEEGVDLEGHAAKKRKMDERTLAALKATQTGQPTSQANKAEMARVLEAGIHALASQGQRKKVEEEKRKAQEVVPVDLTVEGKEAKTLELEAQASLNEPARQEKAVAGKRKRGAVEPDAGTRAEERPAQEPAKRMKPNSAQTEQEKRAAALQAEMGPLTNKEILETMAIIKARSDEKKRQTGIRDLADWQLLLDIEEYYFERHGYISARKYWQQVRARGF